jgi:hypothetical protein
MYGELLDVGGDGPEEPVVDIGIIHDPLGIIAISRNSPDYVAMKGKLP